MQAGPSIEVVPTASRPRSSDRRARGSLTADQIVDTAIALATEQGERGVSMRRIAGTLGVRPATIYWHVGDRDALLDAMASRIAIRQRPPRSRARTPQGRIRAVARALRAELTSRPRLLAVLGRSGRIGPVIAPLRDACLSELFAAGFTGEDALRRVRTVVFHVAGFVLVERGLAAYRPSAPNGDVVDLAGLPAPHAIGVAASTLDADRQFDFSLRCVLEGVFDRS